MPRNRTLPWVTGFAVALMSTWLSTALAQNAPGGGGGPGGGGRRGGGFGGFFPGGPGNSDPMYLVRDPAIQDELKLNKKQREAIDKLNTTINDKRQQIRQQMRNNFNPRNFNQNNPNAGVQPQFDPNAMRAVMDEMRATMENLQKEGENNLGRILDAKQRTRLYQLSIQREGLMAVVRPDVAAKINLSPQQIEKIQVIIDTMRTAQGEAWQAMRPRRGNNGGGPGGGGPGFGGPGGGGPGFGGPGGGGPGFGGPGGGGPGGGGPGFGGPGGGGPGGAGRARGGPGGGGPGGAAPGGGGPGGAAQSGGPGGATPGAAPGGGGPGFGGPGGGGPGGGGRGNRPQLTDEQRAQFQAQMQKMRETSDKIREDALQQINKSLSKKQGAAFKKLMGEPFDFSKLTVRGFGGPRGPQNGQNGGNGNAASGGAGGPGGNAAPKADSARTPSRKNARTPRS